MTRCLSLAACVVVLMAAAATTQATIVYTATLDGASEVPSNGSPGTGTATVTYDPVLHMLGVSTTFSGLLGNTTASHIHCPTAVAGAGTAGVATAVPTFPGFPLGVTSGTYSNTLDLTLATSWNPAFVTGQGSGTLAGAEAVLAAALADGTAYFNIHTSTFGGGEIRGFLTPAPTVDGTVPEPLTLGCVLLGLAGMGGYLRKRQPA